MATLTDLPPHVWAHVLRHATVHDLFVVAHVCRALHGLIASAATCTCATVAEMPAKGEKRARSHAHAFWTHWRNVRPPPSLDAWRMYACQGHVAHVALALRCGVDPGADDQCAVRYASGNGHVEVVELLLRDERVDPSVRDQQALYWAAVRGHMPVLERLLRDERVDPSANGQCAIRWAIEAGRVVVVDRLLRDPRVDPSAANQEAIWAASRHGHVKVVERLLRDERVDPGAREHGALRVAIRFGHVDVVEVLLRDPRVDRGACEHGALRDAILFGHACGSRGSSSARRGGIGLSRRRRQRTSYRTTRRHGK